MEYLRTVMNILVTGSNGQLGTELRLAAAGSSHKFIFTGRSDCPGRETILLDITDKDAVRITAASEKADVIINCAAYTDVEGAESDEFSASLLNCTGVDNLAQVAAELNATLIHISTDYVFSGMGCTPIKENAPTDPRSVYGRTKLNGEKKVEESGCNYIILRTSWLYSPFGKNFLKTMRRIVRNSPNAKVVYDQIGSPTAAADLADAIMHIINTGQLDKKGIYNFSDEGAVSWYDFACTIKKLHPGAQAAIKPCLGSEYPTKAQRPHYSVLDKSLFKSSFNYTIPYWADSLEATINRLTELEESEKK